MTTNMQKYYGFKVEVDNKLTAAELKVLEQYAHELATIHTLDVNRYLIYFHTIRVTKLNRSHFGFDGGLAERIFQLILEFHVNKKQQEDNSIRFFNGFLSDINMPEHQGRNVIWSSSDHVVEFHIPGDYFSDRFSFRSALVTFVDRGIRHDHQKITGKVSVVPTTEFARHIQARGNIVKRTEISISLRKSIQLTFPAEREEVTATAIPIQDGVANNTFIFNNLESVNINNAAVLSVQTFNRDPAFLELTRLLLEMADDKNIPAEETERVRRALTSNDRKTALGWIATTGRWTLGTAEKLSLAVASAFIKEAISGGS